MLINFAECNNANYALLRVGLMLMYSGLEIDPYLYVFSNVWMQMYEYQEPAPKL